MTPLAAALFLAAILLPISIAGLNMALGLLTLALCVRLNNEKTRATVFSAWRSEPAVSALLAYCAVGLLSSVCGLDFSRSLRDNTKDLHRLWSLLLFVAAFRLENPRWLWPALGLGFLFTSLVGIVQVAHHSLFIRLPDHPMMRAHGFVHPVTYGQQFALALLGVLSFRLRPSNASRSRSVAAFFVVALSALVLCQTRSALLALAAGFSVLCLLEPKLKRSFIWILLGLAGAVVLWEVLPTGGRSLFELTTMFDPKNPNQTRYTLWSVALQIFQDHPLTGAGPGHYRTLFSTYWPHPLDNDYSWGSAHNLYLHQLAERGLLGLAALLAALAAFVRGAWRSACAHAAPARALWALAAVAAFLVMGLTEVVFENEQLATLFLFVWAWGRAEREEA